MQSAIVFPGLCYGWNTKELGKNGSFAHMRCHFHRTTATTLTKLLGLAVKAIVSKLRADLPP